MNNQSQIVPSNNSKGENILISCCIHIELHQVWARGRPSWKDF